MSDGQVEFIPFDDPRLGRHIRHDPRNKEHPAPRALAATPKEDIRHRNYSRYKLFQANVGACTGFTGAQALNTSLYRVARRQKGKRKLCTNKDGFDYYSGATKRDVWGGVWPPDDTGSSGHAVCLELQARGEITGYEWAFGVDHGLQSLPAGALMVGTWWQDGMFRPDADGRVHVRGGDRGGHEYLWVGYEIVSRLNPSQNKIWCLNHWEDEKNNQLWGVNTRGKGPGGGYFYMIEEEFRGLIARDGDLIRLVI